MLRNVAYESRALLYGHEGNLMQSRQWLLAAAGCECITATSLPEFRAKALGTAPNLIILCQTASDDECASATAFAAEHLPGSQMLIMFGQNGRCEPTQEYVLLDSMAGPEVFVRTTARLLTKASVQASYAS